MKKLLKSLVPFSSPCWKIQRFFFKCQVSWDQGRRIKGFVATVSEDEAPSFFAGAPGTEVVLV